MRVFKYEIPIEDEPTVRLPRGAGILSVGQQNGGLFLWALVDPSVTETERRVFRIAGTGHEIAEAEGLSFIGTVFMCGSALVFHIFEREE
jgi:hypothetical protein